MQIRNENPNEPAIEAFGAPNQTANLFEVKDNGGTIRFSVGTDGELSAGIQGLAYTTNYANMTAAMAAARNTDTHQGNYYLYDGGMALYHPETTLVMDDTATVVIPSFTNIYGANRQRSIFSVVGKTDTWDVFKYRVYKIDYVSGALHWDCTMRDIMIIGDYHIERTPIGTGLSAWNGTYGGGYGLNFENVELRDFGGDGFHFDSSDGSPPDGWIGGINMLNVYCRGIATKAIYLGNYATFCHFDHVHVTPWQDQENPHYGGTGMFFWGVSSTDVFYSCTEGCNKGVEWTAGQCNRVVGHYCETSTYPYSFDFWNDSVFGDSYANGAGSSFSFSNSSNCMFTNGLAYYNSTDNPIIWLQGACSGTVVRNFRAGPDEPPANKTVDTSLCSTWPDYIEDVRTTAYPHPRPLLNGTQIRVKATSGAPTDALFGNRIGSLVYNSADKVLYVHGPDGADDWDVV